MLFGGVLWIFRSFGDIIIICVIELEDGMMVRASRNEISNPSLNSIWYYLHLLCTNALGKDMNPSLLSPVMSIIIGQNLLSSLGWQSVQEEDST